MVIKFDRFERFEEPQLILCNPGSKYVDGNITLPIGELSNTTDLEIQFNFGSPSELNFRLNNVPQESDENAVFIQELFDKTSNRRMLYLPEIGLFQITATKNGHSGKTKYKDVTAKSCDYELARKNIPYIPDDTYILYSTDAEHPGLLNIALKVAPSWVLNYVDPDVAGLYRTFEDVDVDKDLLTFLTEDIQKAYGCIVLFDVLQRKINVYAKENFHNHTDVHLALEDLITDVVISEDADNLFTALRLTSNDDIAFGMINPLGGNIIYNFHYYLSWMSPSLRTKMIAWEELLPLATTSYQTYCELYYESLDYQNDLLAEEDRLQILLDLYQTCKTNFEEGMEDIPVDLYNSQIEAADGSDIIVYDEVSTTIAAIQVQIDDVLDQKEIVDEDLEDVEAQLETLETEMQAIRDAVSFSEILTADEYAELSCYVFEGNYTDEYIALTESMTTSQIIEQMQAAYDRAEEKLSDISQPTREFDISTVSFIFIKAFQHWTEQLFTGCLINVETADNVVEELFLTGINVNYEERTANLSFGNRVYRNDAKALFSEVLGEITLTANTIL